MVYKIIMTGLLVSWASSSLTVQDLGKEIYEAAERQMPKFHIMITWYYLCSGKNRKY